MITLIKIYLFKMVLSDLVDSMEAVSQSSNKLEWIELRRLIKTDTIDSLRNEIKLLKAQRVSFRKSIKLRNDQIEYYKNKCEKLQGKDNE